VVPAAGPAWARGTASLGAGLWITADRIVGFVPFTVYVYGKVLGGGPGQVQLCRSEVAWMTEPSGGRSDMASPMSPLDPARQPADDAACATGETVRTPDGYQYTRDMHFDHPGVYHIRLMMVDAAGRRVVSNTVRVSAF
jgi:hypothetical protein